MVIYKKQNYQTAKISAYIIILLTCLLAIKLLNSYIICEKAFNLQIIESLSYQIIVKISTFIIILIACL